MRILVISQYFPPDGGGGSKRVANAITGLSKLGHDVEVVTGFPHYPHGNIPREFRLKAYSQEIWKGMLITRVWLPSLPHAGFLRRLVMYVTFSLSALIALPIIGASDIIWAANANVFSSLPAIVYSFFKRAPVVRNVDDLWPETAIEEGYLKEGMLARIGRLLAKFAYKACKALTPISKGYRRELVKKYKIPPNKIHVVEVGVNTQEFIPIKERKMKARRIHPITVMYSGILGTGYNLDYLLEVADLLKHDKTIQFVIRGFGERQKEIKRKEKSLDNLEFSGSFLAFAELIRVLNSADILFLPMSPLPAHEAGLPTKLFEYMACGKPIVCSSEGDAAALVRDAKCGIVVSPNNPSDAVDAILTLKANESLRHSMGRKGRRYIEEHLSIEKISRKLERVFMTVSNLEK